MPNKVIKDDYLSETYKTSKGNPVTLIITIGHTQLGRPVVRLGRQKLTPANNRNPFKWDLGAGETLVGKILRCTTGVADVSAQTDEVSITYRLETDGSYEEWTQKMKISDLDFPVLVAKFEIKDPQGT